MGLTNESGKRFVWGEKKVCLVWIKTRHTFDQK